MTHNQGSAQLKSICVALTNILRGFELYQSGLLYFHNDQGDEASCKVDKSLPKGQFLYRR